MPGDIGEPEIASAVVMKTHGIIIKDLFIVNTPHLAMVQPPNGMHFNTKDFDFLDWQIWMVLSAALK